MDDRETMTETLCAMLARRGFGRRSLLQFAIAMTSSLALPPSVAPVMAANLAKATRRSVIWLSFQECTGCLETLLRSSSPTIDSLIFDFISLDYQEALMAAAGDAAERTLREAVAANKGQYLLAIDGSIPIKDGGVYSLTGGRSNVEMLAEIATNARAVLAIGTCAAYGGIPKAYPNPTGAVGVDDLVSGKPIVNIPGCPPVPEVLSGVLSTSSASAVCRISTTASARLHISAPQSTTSATVGRSTIRASLPRASMTRVPVRAGACSSSGARDRRRTTPVPA
jgi:hydrogenase small subunit